MRSRCSCGRPTERDPGHLGERSSVVVRTDETIGIEAQGVRPGSGIAAREMRRPEDQCALRDAHAAFLTAACKGPEDSLTMYSACTKREDGRGDTGIRSARPRDNCGREGSGPRRTASEVGRPGAPSDRPIMPDGEHEAALPKCRSRAGNSREHQWFTQPFMRARVGREMIGGCTGRRYPPSRGV